MTERQNTDRRLGPDRRIKRRLEFARVFERGRRMGDNVITLLALRRAAGPSRLGVAVSKKHGHAVARNRVKRLCREAFRLVRADLPVGWDYVVIPRASVRHTLAGLEASLLALAGRAAKRGGSESSS